MNVLGHIGGVALIVAAFAFHFRARFLGEQALGWPAAPRRVRWAIDGVSGVLTAAGFWWAATGNLPDEVQTVVAIVIAIYAVITCWNIAGQRGSTS